MNTDILGVHRNWAHLTAGLFNTILRHFPPGVRGRIVAVIGEFAAQRFSTFLPLRAHKLRIYLATRTQGLVSAFSLLE
jgi:hypothetical protein